MYQQKHKKVRRKPIAEYFPAPWAAEVNPSEQNTNETQEESKDKYELDPGEGT